MKRRHFFSGASGLARHGINHQSERLGWPQRPATAAEASSAAPQRPSAHEASPGVDGRAKPRLQLVAGLLALLCDGPAAQLHRLSGRLARVACVARVQRLVLLAQAPGANLNLFAMSDMLDMPPCFVQLLLSCSQVLANCESAPLAHSVSLALPRETALFPAASPGEPDENASEQGRNGEGQGQIRELLLKRPEAKRQLKNPRPFRVQPGVHRNCSEARHILCGGQFLLGARPGLQLCNSQLVLIAMLQHPVFLAAVTLSNQAVRQARNNLSSFSLYLTTFPCRCKQLPVKPPLLLCAACAHVVQIPPLCSVFQTIDLPQHLAQGPFCIITTIRA